MLIADGIGIIVGILLRKKIPERTVKLVSAGAFILFGLIGTYQVLSSDFKLALPLIVLALSVIAAITAVSAYLIIRHSRKANGAGKP
jgi:predicted MFS family arabinose efflux permease